MNFNDIKPEDYSRETFGKCIRARREELKMTVRALAKEIGMSPVYLSDIERGNRCAPSGVNSKIDYMANMIQALQISEEEQEAFFVIAEASNGHYADINLYLSKKPVARVALRLAEEHNISDEQWQEFIRLIKEQSSAD